MYLSYGSRCAGSVRESRWVRLFFVGGPGEVCVSVILDIIHVVEYVWKAGHVFHREGSPELAH